MKKLIKAVATCLVVIFVVEVLPVQPTKAAAQFSTGYDINFNFGDSGSASVTQRISLTNLTNNFYASEYSLTIGSDKVTGASGSDSLGSVPINTKVENGSTILVVSLNQKIVGQNRVSNFQINYSIDGLAIKRGLVWEVNIPQIVTSENVAGYKLSLSIPKSFGSLGKITPSFVSKEETEFAATYIFDKNSLSSNGIGANFGEYQEFSFTLKYRYKNNALYSQKASIALPPDTEYQAVYYKSIDPKPDKIYPDSSGNYLADFTVKAKKNLEVIVSGLTKIVDMEVPFQKPFAWSEAELAQFTKADRFIDVGNPKIQQKAKELAGPKEIYDFVATTLKYDYTRLEKNSLGRRGSIAALNEPEKSICTDFSDLFVALARAKGIPARGLVGFAYTDNTNLRPTKIEGLVNTTILHAWPEYYDREKGRWVQIDPTWSSTTGGIDYFNRLDTNHFVFAINGTSSQDPLPAGAYKTSSEQVDDVKVDFSSEPLTIEPKISLDLEVDKIIAGFPSNTKLTVENNSGRAVFGAKITTAANDVLGLSTQKETEIGILMPFSKTTIPLNLRSNSLLTTKTTNLSVQLVGSAEKPVELMTNKAINVRPFFSLNWQQATLLFLAVLVIISWIFPHFVSKKAVNSSTE